MTRRVHFADKSWRPEPNTLIHTGYYTVPDELPTEWADRAVAEGAAVEVEDNNPQTSPPAKTSPKKPKG